MATENTEPSTWRSNEKWHLRKCGWDQITLVCRKLCEILNQNVMEKLSSHKSHEYNFLLSVEIEQSFALQFMPWAVDTISF